MARKNEKKEMSRDKAIDLTVSAIERHFGKGSIMRLGADDNLVGQIPAIPTGALGLAIALGIKVFSSPKES